MSNPVVLITGALTGIGRATALAFAKDGAIVVAAGPPRVEGKALESELRAIGAEAAFIRANVRHEDEVRNLVDRTVARFGRLDVAVNNAGTEGKPGPVTEQTRRELRGDVRHQCARHAVEHEARTARHAARRAAAASSISPRPWASAGAANLSLYTASKHAVEGLTKSAALEAAASGVRVNAVAPGPTETAMLDRLTGTPDKKAAILRRRALQARRQAGRDRRRDRVSRLRQSVVHHRTDLAHQRRQNRKLSPLLHFQDWHSGDTTMTQHTHQTAPTQYVEANGIRFAYRRFGKPNASPSSSTSTTPAPWTIGIRR